MAGSTTLAKYVVLLEAQSARYEKAIERAERKTRKFDRAVKTSVKRIKLSFAALGAGISVRAITQAAGRSLEYADSLAKLNDRLGVSVEALSELQFAAERSGVNFRTLTLGMQRLQRRVSEAAGGFGEARAAIAELGLDAKKLEQLELDQQFEVVADRLAQVSTSADRTRLAFKLFDSEGVALTQIMKDGASGIRELRKEAQDLGRTLSKDQAQRAVEAKDAITNLNTSFAVLTDSLVTKAAPAITLVANALSNLISTSRREEIENYRRSIEVLEQTIARLESNTKGAIQTPQILDFKKDLREARLELDKLIAQEALLKFSDPSGGAAGGGGALKKTEKTLERIVDRTGNVQRAFAFMYNDMTMLGEAWSDDAEDIFDKFAAENQAATERVADAAKDLGFQFASAFEDAIVQGAKFRDVLKGILQDIARIFIRRSITEPLAAGITATGTADEAHTGTSPYLVGEAGPELFVPRSAGAIIPNNRMGRGGVTVVNNIDARGADEARIMRIMPTLMEESRQQTIASIVQMQREGNL